jgi:dTDP-4-dehydrorhamnose reductase
VRLLLTGASGYFGQHFARAAADRFELHAAYFSHPDRLTAGLPVALDLKQEAEATRTLEALGPKVIVHAAASNRDTQSLDAILPAARALARYAQATGARLIHFSTDLVFDGEHAPYADDAPPDPITPYGTLKAEAETVVAELNPAALVVRPSLIFGFDPIDAQTTWLLDGLRRGETVRLFTDEFRSPVWVHDLTAAILELVEPNTPPPAGRRSRQLSGASISGPWRGAAVLGGSEATPPRPVNCSATTYGAWRGGAYGLAGPMNLGGPQSLNRWDFGTKVLAALGVEPGANLVACTVAESGLKRARNLTLRGDRAAQTLRTRLRPVDEAASLHRSKAQA